MTIRSFLGAIFLWLTLGIAAQSFAQSDPKALIDQLGTADFKQAETLIGQIAATGDARVAEGSRLSRRVIFTCARPIIWCS